MEFAEELKDMLRKGAAFAQIWDWLGRSDFGIFLPDMRKTMQNPAFHGEGTVYVHTKMVCEALLQSEEFAGFSLPEQVELLLAALLHDAGKIRTTVWEDGRWTSPHHSAVGSRMVRTFLWQDCGLCGTAEKIKIRETICGLVRNHMLPARMIDKKNAVLRIRRTAVLGELAGDFTWQKLCLLADADMRGRIAPDVPECLEKIDLCRVLAEEAGCFLGSFPYSDSFAKYAYLSGRNVMPDQFLYNDTWGEVILLAGLPGTGKDTWIARSLPGLPVISLDDIRKELRISPADDQGKVIEEARGRARAFLRKKQPFIWNATNLSKEIRQKQVRLFEQYGAAVRILYLETDEKTRREQNQQRKDMVPESQVERMLQKTEPPLPDEAHAVEWINI